MPERFSSLNRFLLLLALYMGAVTVAFFALSSYYFNDTNIAANYSALTAVLDEEAELLDRYQAGWLSHAGLQQADIAVLVHDDVAALAQLLHGHADGWLADGKADGDVHRPRVPLLLRQAQDHLQVVLG